MSVRLPAAAVLAAALLLAPSAHAATTPVSPGGLQAAVTAAAPGDTLQLAAGEYAESVTVPVAKSNLVFDGSAGARLTGAVAVQAPGTKLSALTLAPAADGLSVAAGAAATLEKVFAARSAGGDVPVLQSAGTLALTDTTVATTTGSGVSITAGTATVLRSSVIATPSAADAVQLTSNTAGDRSFTSDSSLFVGGATGGAGIRATSSGGVPLVSATGAIAIVLRHVTIAGAANGVTVSSANTLNGGAITATAAGSIVHGVSSAASSQATGGASAFTATDSDGPGLTSNTPDAQLFAANYRLRADAPVPGKGGALAAGESATDLNGTARPATGNDMGAAQFVNRAPGTGLTLSAGVVDEGATVTATLAATDPDAGDAIGTYAFNWGDGTQTVGQSPTATHVFPKPGVYQVRGAVADARGVPSAIVSGTVTVRDTSAPVVTITSPKAGTKLKYKRTRRIAFKGTDTDVTGVSKVEVALTRKQGKRCFQYGTTFKKAGCGKVVYKRATLTDQTWSLTTRKRVPLRRGTYTLRVRSIDGIGNATAAPSTRNGLLRRFVIR